MLHERRATCGRRRPTRARGAQGRREGIFAFAGPAMAPKKKREAGTEPKAKAKAPKAAAKAKRPNGHTLPPNYVNIWKMGPAARSE